MKIRKMLSRILVVVMLLTCTVSAFAEVRTISNGTYIAGKVKHKFTTSNYVTKALDETWLQVRDDADYSYFCNENTGEKDEEGYHHTYLADYNGNKLTSSYKVVNTSGEEVFYSTEMSGLNSYTLIKLQIYNPKYGTAWYLQTSGTIKGASK